MNPFDDEPASPTLAEFVPIEDSDELLVEEEQEQEKKEEKAEEAQELPPRSSSILFTLLFTWASLATILAGYLWVKSPERGPLQDLPDDGSKKISPLEKLTDRELIGLGKTKRFGELEVTPLKIEHRSLKIPNPPYEDFETEPLLVLSLRLKNVSSRHTFHPTDPVFFYYRWGFTLEGLEKIFPKQPGYTYTFVHSSDSNRPMIKPYRLMYYLEEPERFEGQTFEPLRPGEVTETIVVMGRGIQALNKNSSELIWRVQLRKGISPNGNSVATVIGVQFDKRDVQNAERGLRNAE